MLTLFAVIAAVVFIWLVAALSVAVWFVIELVAQNKEYEAVRKRLEKMR